MLEKLLKFIARALDRGSIPYMVIGGQAAVLYGEPRFTRDIDLTLGVGVEAVEKIAGIIKKLGFRILAKDYKAFVQKTMVLPAEDPKSGMRIDFIFSYSPYEMQAIKHAKIFKFGGTIVKFASLEDVVIHKIIAGRPRDIEDIKAILLKNPKFDKRYIKEWLKEFDVSLDESFLSAFEKLLKQVFSS